MSEYKTGIGSIITEEFSPDDPVPGSVQAEQLPLLPVLCEDGAENAGGKGAAAPRGVGRPVGARNRSTEEWRSFILSRFSSPLIGLAELSTMPLQGLIDEIKDILGKKTNLDFDQLMRLLVFQKDCRKELAPYLHKKQAIAIDAGESGLIHLTINNPTPQNAVQNDIVFIDVKDQQNQAFNNSGNEKSVIPQLNKNVAKADFIEHSQIKPSDYKSVEHDDDQGGDV